MTIDPEIRTEAETAVLCWLATVDSTGTPNVTLKEIFAFYGDEHLVIADTRHPIRSGISAAIRRSA
jgi:predicted pyridoxine 5'-phosphate oxidase superfamily flavin-nucleotide-binding protein